MKATLIISVYKDAEALEAVLKSVLIQVEKNIEVIVSQDCEDPCFDELIRKYGQSIRIKHLQQPDLGFLKNKMLNRAIKASSTDKLIFIDGDCVLHPRFAQQHILSLRKGRFCIGRRVDLDPKTSQKIRKGLLVIPSFIEMIRNKSIRTEESFFLPGFAKKSKGHLLGCNMSWHKSDLILLNGFDETYINPGFGEDTDIEFRAKKAGLKPYSTRFRTIQYHLFHERPDREDFVTISKNQFFEKKNRTDFRCQFGLETLEA
ncbi:glycosyltransferase [Fluviicola sp.]|uniref:glycosyltransferase n=1 Tax=Fluviicola sp. TaxID=1917219 RepID=UPI00282A0EF4|nr:glycosyltransferase [Fluviicola sp.]MDR0803152.1 glycosyltransferase [Fluviicola sp.]